MPIYRKIKMNCIDISYGEFYISDVIYIYIYIYISLQEEECCCDQRFVILVAWTNS